MARQEVESISDVSSVFESSGLDIKAPRSTYSVVEDKQQAERSSSLRLADKPTAKSMPSTLEATKDSPRGSKQELHRSVPESSFSASSTTVQKSTDRTKKPMPQTVETLPNRERSDSLSSTVSSIPEPSVVENALKSGTATAANTNRRPIANLVSGLHSFTSLLEKENSQQGNNSRSAPVVNALKLAERSRVAEEKKRLEKEKRKALLKKKMEEHKKAAALKEKAEKDAQAKREQERLNERKKREAELARRRQQKLKEMRAGLEKKRAMLAAEKKAGLSSRLLSLVLMLLGARSTCLEGRTRKKGNDSFSRELVLYMKDERRDNNIVTTRMMIDYMKEHHHDWLIKYLATKKNEDSAQKALYALCQNFAKRHGFSSRAPVSSNV
ncbi:hypothetical protein PPTG_19175 [Phytophthora nicotianae INRA-310]|uniref:Uncharacterized protein n=1 Tax=Phytophthora nicotianae (strain INRA-310) TaxID=761204 RepID=W2PD48_PHYN3|nr:hypothetical protein PPTG_19175 [Phytophthora nicotianae INRA-310]ETM98967.1 hypothetical protein PPTG_19175 [Phytophthora nicotianae INRA-310]